MTSKHDAYVEETINDGKGDVAFQAVCPDCSWQTLHIHADEAPDDVTDKIDWAYSAAGAQAAIHLETEN